MILIGEIDDAVEKSVILVENPVGKSDVLVEKSVEKVTWGRCF